MIVSGNKGNIHRTYNSQYSIFTNTTALIVWKKQNKPRDKRCDQKMVNYVRSHVSIDMPNYLIYYEPEHFHQLSP